ncbi:MAG: cyclic nucleotide-binding domain-containing protein [Nitrospinota bacterium]
MKNIPVVGRFQDGEVIVTEGVASNNAYVVLSGKVKVVKKTDNKQVVIGTLSKGSVFGEMGLIGASTRTATVSAIGETNIGIIDKESFVKMLEQLPEDLRPIVNSLVERLKITTAKLAKIGLQLENAKKVITSFSINTKDNFDA